MRSRACLAFAYGLSGLAAQTLLLRECIAALGGADLCIGLFLALWFLGSAIGVLLFRRAGRGESLLVGAAEPLVIVSILVLCLQYGLIVFLPTSMSGQSHSIPAFHQMLRWLSLIAIPGGLLTGLLFPILCQRIRRHENSPISVVCMLAGGGAVVGGLGMTALLHYGFGTVHVLLVLAAVVCGCVAWSSLARVSEPTGRIGRAVAIVSLVVVLSAAALRVDLPLTKIVQENSWTEVVPSGHFDGSFSTRQGEYLYGTDGDRWVVVRRGNIHETMGDPAAAGKVAALTLSQNFAAERILVIGDGLSLCGRFLRSPRVKAVDWYAPDPQYLASLLAHLPEAWRPADARLHSMTQDIRTALADRPGAYDAVVINMPAAVYGELHPFASVEFFEQIKRSLRTLGVVVVGIPTDGRVSGREPAYQGAWVESTLNAVFAQTILVPDEGRTFFVSAASMCLEVSPVILQTRFGLMENAGDIYPVESLASLYRPDRALAMSESCDAVRLPEQALVSSDNKPSHYLCHVLQGVDRSGLSMVKLAQPVLAGGLAMVVVPLVLLTLTRLVYEIRTAPRAKRSLDASCPTLLQSNVQLLVGCAGAGTVAVAVTVLYGWQARLGSLHAHAGTLLSSGMLGLVAGACSTRWAASRLHSGSPTHLRPILSGILVLLGVYAMCLTAPGFVAGNSLSEPILIGLLLVSGFLGGSTLVLGARMLEGSGLDPDSAVTRLAAAGFLGAMTGGAAASLFLIPLLSLHATAYVLAVLMLGTAAFAGVARFGVMRPGPRVVAHPVLTPLGYAMFGITISIVAGAHILAHLERSRVRSQSTTAVKEWVEGRRVSAKTVALASASKQTPYQEVRDGSGLKGYIFRSDDFSNTVYGYGGPMSIVMFTDPNGALVDFRITRSYETPRYLSRIRGWMDSLKGRRVFGPAPLQQVNAVSGATLSCNAVLRLLRNSGGQFEASLFARDQAAQATRAGWMDKMDWLAAYWIAGVVFALVVIHHGRLWSRLVLLAYTAGVGGFWLNRQYSTDHAMRLLSGDGVLAGPLAGLCLLLGVPLLLLLVGNIYCGYLCPFGALQELIGLIVPHRFKIRLSLSAMGAGRFVKYGVLAVLVIAFFVTRNTGFSEADPLVSFFSGQSWSQGLFSCAALVTAVLVLACGLVVTRVWCRYLCPTGAFLSLFNMTGWLGRWLPAKKFGRCEFGLSGRDHLDCIHCDRCRYETRLLPTRDQAVAKTRLNVVSGLFVAFVAAVALWTLAAASHKAPPTGPGAVSSPVVEGTRVQGGVPNVPAAPNGGGLRSNRGQRR